MSIIPVQDPITTALTRQATPLTTTATPSTTNVSDVTSNTPVSDSASVTTGTSQQQAASLQNASVNIAQLGSLLEVAQSGTGQVANILQQLQGLAQQAQDDVPATTVSQLDSRFQQLAAQLQLAVGNTSFGGSSLLDGTFSSQASGSDASSLSLPNLTSQSLFGSTTPNILTPANAANAATALANAQGLVAGTTGSLQGLQSQVNQTAAGIQSILANNIAAASTLTESDLSSGAIDTAFAQFINAPALSAQAQTGNLPANILSLLQE